MLVMSDDMSIPFGVFSICDRITNDILKKDFEDATGFFVDKTGNTLHTTTTSQTPYRLETNIRNGKQVA
jgi:hypothetical protein